MNKYCRIDAKVPKRLVYWNLYWCHTISTQTIADKFGVKRLTVQRAIAKADYELLHMRIDEVMEKKMRQLAWLYV